MEKWNQKPKQPEAEAKPEQEESSLSSAEIAPILKVLEERVAGIEPRLRPEQEEELSEMLENLGVK